MFKKKPNIKSFAPIRSSDRRKIADQIIAQYQLEVPKQERVENGEDGGDVVISPINALRHSLLPDGALSARFSTTAGQDLKTVSGIVYVGTHAGEEQRILWIRLDERILPSVYTLWHRPRLVPLLHTPNMVLQKMQGGADLNTPGLLGGPPFPPKARMGAVVAIASYEKPSIPMVVGICEIDVSALQQVQGEKGHAVRGVHWQGDEIWNWSQVGTPGAAPPESLEGWNEDASNDIMPDVKELKIEKLDEEADVEMATVDRESIASETLHSHEDIPVKYKELSTKDIDTAFRNAFLYAMHNARNNHKTDPSHGISFPVPQSQFVSSFILPYLPTFTQEDAASLQIKKTSWKNVKKFIKTLEKEQLLKSKDRNGGETVVQDVSFDEPSIVDFKPYGLPKKESIGAETDGGGDGRPSIGGDASIGQQLKRLSLLKPKEKLTPLLARSKANTHALYLPAELRPLITAYIESEHLVNTVNKRLVSLDPVLANTVLDSGSSIDREVLAKGSIPRDVLIDRIIQGCAPYWAILRNGESRNDAKPRAGHVPNVKILLDSRSGNKTVTKVSGLEVFHVNPQMLADELQKACASSTSVGQLAGSSPKTPVMEVMVQGPQKDAVIKALEKRGLRKEWIEVIDKTKGKKGTNSNGE